MTIWRDLFVFILSRCVKTPTTFGKPWACRHARASKVTISKPKDASTVSNTKSATLQRSINAQASSGHSIKVILLSLPEMMVMGPSHVFKECLVCSLTRDLISVVLPEPLGPTTTITVGATPLSRLTAALTSLRWDRSALRCTLRFDRPKFATPNARVLCFPLCWPVVWKRSLAFLVVWARPSFRGLWRALLCVASAMMAAGLSACRLQRVSARL